LSNVVAIIPARGGSKRIPQKNIRPFAGKPIIAYSIKAALEAKCFAQVMVSTDDPQIAEIGKQYGATVPFFRSEKNSDDYSGIAEVLVEVLDQYEKSGQHFDYVCCLLPTAPFVTAKRLLEGRKLLIESGADTVVPVTRFSYPIQRAMKIDGDRMLKMFWPENYEKRSQDLEPAYHDVGQFYWAQTSVLCETMQLFCDNTMPLVIPEMEVQDIDSEEDWKIAEFKYQMFSQSLQSS
jgi:N-acylneuraminate cytidylyltransferase